MLNVSIEKIELEMLARIPQLIQVHFQKLLSLCYEV